MLLGVPGLTTRRKEMPPLREACVCVTLGVIGILPDLFNIMAGGQ